MSESQNAMKQGFYITLDQRCERMIKYCFKYSDIVV